MKENMGRSVITYYMQHNVELEEYTVRCIQPISTYENNAKMKKNKIGLIGLFGNLCFMD